MNEKKEAAREHVKRIQAEFAEKGDVTSWFEALYSSVDGDNEKIPWADLEPNEFLTEWSDRVGLKGNGRKALVVGCGLGDDAGYLEKLGFEVTAFDISPTAINWAKKLHPESNIRFVAADLFDPPKEWTNAFDFVLEIYTIQPLPLDLRPSVIDAIANFVTPGGELVVITRGREDDEVPDELPWALSRRDLSRFIYNGLIENDFEVIPNETGDPPVPRFIVRYKRPDA